MLSCRWSLLKPSLYLLIYLTSLYFWWWRPPRLSRRNHQKYKPQMEQRSAGGMTSSNVKTAAKLPAYFSTRIPLQRLFEQWRSKWEVEFCVCLGRHGKKTDILDLFWHFSIKLSDIVMLLIGVWTLKPTQKKGCFGKNYMFDWKMSKQIKDISFTHKIQLLMYSCNVQRAFAVILSLKSQRESEKKRKLGNQNSMHVLTLLNTINIQAHQRVQTVVNRGRIQSRCYFN